MSSTAVSVTPPAPGERSLAPDLARGTMLLLIAVANVAWHLWGQGTQVDSQHLPAGSTLDKGVRAFAAIAVDGRVYPMFAFLFGYGMVQFWAGRRRRGFDRGQIRRMLRRRHWAMIAFGVVHALLLFVGDILGAYGLAGLLLVWLFFERRDITLKIWTGVLLGLLALWAVFSLIGGFFTAQLPAEVLTQIEAQSASPGQSIGWMREFVSADPNYLSSAVKRLAVFPVLALMQVVALSIPAAILLGWLAARHRVLEEPARHRVLLRRTAVIGIGVGWAGGIPVALQHLEIWGPPAAAWWMFNGLTGLTGLAAGVGYVALFGLIAARGDLRGGLGRAVAAVGKRSLTFYLLQSLLFAPVLAPWGLGFGSRFGTAASWAFAVAVWVLSVVLAHLMERRGMRGPCEVVLRRLTTAGMEPAQVSAAAERGAQPT